MRTTATTVALALAALGLATPIAAQTFASSPPATEAARLFQKVCVLHRARLIRAVDTLEGLNFISQPEAEDDIWFHPTYDLSFSIRPADDGGSVCSMVWSSLDPLSANVSAIFAIAPDAERPDYFNEDLMRTRIHGTD